MKTEKEQFEELCSAYAFGALDEENIILFDEALINGGDVFLNIFRESIGVSYLLNGGIVRVTPSSEVKLSLLRKINQSRKRTFFLTVERILQKLGFVNPIFSLIISKIINYGMVIKIIFQSSSVF